MVDIGTSFIAYNAVLALGYGAGIVVASAIDSPLSGVLIGVGLSVLFLDHLNLLLFQISREVGEA
ncbi:hypothetical protein [Halorarius litoreus]|jgi:hypothetical protein|uniref:hypothetical protein n=1 Tax=Halorarius litoreus TaxID=2962676 RepID=UPI0020CFE15E|nr:hypothetical protein [Halorarius litoreus]